MKRIDTAQKKSGRRIFYVTHTEKTGKKGTGRAT